MEYIYGHKELNTYGDIEADANIRANLAENSIKRYFRAPNYVYVFLFRKNKFTLL